MIVKFCVAVPTVAVVVVGLGAVCGAAVMTSCVSHVCWSCSPLRAALGGLVCDVCVWLLLLNVVFLSVLVLVLLLL